MIETLIELAKSKDFLFIGIIAAYFFAIKFTAIQNFIEQFGKPSTSLLNEIAENKFVDNQLKNTAIRQLRKEYFYKFTKLYIEDARKRSLLMELSENSNGKLPLFHFRRAYRFLEFKEDGIKVKIPKWIKWADKVNKFFSLFLLISGIFILLVAFLAIYNFGLSKETLSILLSGLILWLLALYAYINTFHIWSAEYIEKYFKNKFN